MGEGVPADGVDVVEVGVLLVQTKHLLEGAGRVQRFLLALYPYLCHRRQIFISNLRIRLRLGHDIASTFRSAQGRQGGRRREGGGRREGREGK